MIFDICCHFIVGPLSLQGVPRTGENLNAKFPCPLNTVHLNDHNLDVLDRFQ